MFKIFSIWDGLFLELVVSWKGKMRIFFDIFLKNQPPSSNFIPQKRKEFRKIWTSKNSVVAQNLWEDGSNIWRCGHFFNMGWFNHLNHQVLKNISPQKKPSNKLNHPKNHSKKPQPSKYWNHLNHPKNSTELWNIALKWMRFVGWGRLARELRMVRGLGSLRKPHGFRCRQAGGWRELCNHRAVWCLRWDDFGRLELFICTLTYLWRKPRGSVSFLQKGALWTWRRFSNPNKTFILKGRYPFPACIFEPCSSSL